MCRPARRTVREGFALSSPLRRATAAPVLTAAVAAVALAALVVVYLAVLRPDRADARSAGSGAGSLTTQEQRAVVAAGTETANLLSFRRAHFAGDFARALAGVTGAMLKDVQSNKARTLLQMTKGKFDLGAKVLHQALEGSTEKGSGYVVLVSVNAFRSTTATTPLLQNFEITVTPVKGKYLVSDVRLIGVQ